MLQSMLRVCLFIASLAGVLVSQGSTASSVDPRAMIEKAIPYLKENGVKWMKKRKCVSCHQVTTMLWSLNAAERVGISVGQDELTEWTQWAAETTGALHQDPQKTPPVDNMIQLLLGRGGSYDPSAEGIGATNYPSWIIAQRTNGFWKAGGQLPRQKRPARETDEVTTMWTLLALTTTRDQGTDLQSARDWLAKGKPGVSTEWWVVRALTELDEKKRAQHQATLIELQNEDGGWGWIAGQSSDALATGMALYALAELNVSPQRKFVQRAHKHLADSQQENGSWEVPSTKKANKGETGPVSNYWGTGWAVIGLAASLARQQP